MIQETITIGEILPIAIILGGLCGIFKLIAGVVADKQKMRQLNKLNNH